MPAGSCGNHRIESPPCQAVLAGLGKLMRTARWSGRIRQQRHDFTNDHSHGCVDSAILYQAYSSRLPWPTQCEFDRVLRIVSTKDCSREFFPERLRQIYEQDVEKDKQSSNEMRLSLWLRERANFRRLCRTGTVQTRGSPLRQWSGFEPRE